MKKAKHRIPTFDNRTALLLTLYISIIIIVIMLFAYFQARAKDVGYLYDIGDLMTLSVALTFLSNTVLLYLLFRFQFWVINSNLNKKLKATVAVVGSIILLLILSPLMAQIHMAAVQDRMPANVFQLIYLVKNAILLIITFLFTALVYMVNMTQKTLQENQKLMVENLQNRYDALKSQVDPHFLFNSLNTLNGLIGYDNDKAHEYVDQLSMVFRYTMQNKPVIQVMEELEFVEAYASLMQIRYNESLSIEYHIDKKYRDYYILPLGIQLLLENAVKHNVISNKYPLLITIETTDNDMIKVTNNLQPKPDSKHGGVGLSNLNERYQLMFGQFVSISQDESSFVVEIPLIKEFDNTKLNTVIDYESYYC